MRAARGAVCGALLGVAAGLMGTGAARAQPAQPGAADDVDAEYAGLVSGALAEFEQGRWDQARVWFERAHALRPNARTLWGLGITAFELGRYPQAITELGSALRDPRLPLEGAQRAQAEEVIARASQYVAVLSVELAPKRARLSLDGAEVSDRELVLSPGTYTLVARAPGFQERELEVQVGPGEKRMLRLELPPIALHVRTPPSVTPSVVATETARVRDEDEDGGSVLESWWLWTAVGVVIAGGVTAFLVIDDGDDSEAVNVRREVLTRQR